MVAPERTPSPFACTVMVMVMVMVMVISTVAAVGVRKDPPRSGRSDHTPTTSGPPRR
ncbi:hypothetical protein [Dactylosporangium sp. NPDC051484]|uniref:hypothetical protein n=1 Tax=Dactylosporangium sp. NPDC051484 TaxID=3154942 RepID=UPI00344FB30D